MVMTLDLNALSSDMIKIKNLGTWTVQKAYGIMRDTKE